ncbi:MAG: DUF4340 domain-containing protein [Puniceicoccales bacterium]|jgi:hypothetical protein|nr:DUF4340 domain-containing protein [Puniceicoccales bacterium]
MRFKITLLLILANVVTFGLIWKSERDRMRPVVADIPLFPAGIRSISVSGSGIPKPYSLERYQREWKITSPFKWEANGNMVNSIIEELRFVQLDRSFTVAEAQERGNSRADYGLENPQAKLIVAGESGSPVEIQIGRPATENNSGWVFLLTADEQIIPARINLLMNLMVTPESMRVPKVFSLSAIEVGRVAIHVMSNNEEKSTFLERTSRPIPGTVDVEPIWRFEAPINADVNVGILQSWLSKLAELRYEKFFDNTPERLEQTGLASPIMRISLFDGQRKGQTLLIGQNDPNSDPKDPSYFAKLEDNIAIFTIKAAEVNTWRNAQQVLRERNFLKFYPALLSEITIHDGDKSLVLHRRQANDKGATDKPAKATSNEFINAGDWIIPVIPGTTATVTMAADPDVMSNLIGELLSLSAHDFRPEEGMSDAQIKLSAAFVNDAPSAEELKALNFDTPVRKVELVFTEGPSITLLIASPVDSRTPFHAKLADKPSVYSIRGIIVDQLSVDPNQYRQRLVEQIPANTQIVALKISDLVTGKVLIDERRPGLETTWENALAERNEQNRKELLGLLAALQTIKAEKFIPDAFSMDFTTNYLNSTTKEGWRYKLEISLRTTSSTTDETKTWFLTKRLGGTGQYMGSPAQGCIFQIQQSLIDAIFPVTFGKDHGLEIPEIKQPEELPPPETSITR